MASVLETIDPAQIGAALVDARNASGITQADAAKRLGVSRPTLVAIEKGQRRVRAEELVTLADAYGRSVSSFVREEDKTFDLRPHLRAVATRHGSDNVEVLEAIAALQNFATDYHRLETLLKLPLATNYPPVVKLRSATEAADKAEYTAVAERHRLNLGDQPVIHLRSVLELEVGLRVIYEDLPPRIAGMFAYADNFGGVIAVNAKHPPERRRATLLHEYGHLLTDREKPGIDYTESHVSKPAGERFADTFAMAFLMPETSIRRMFQQIIDDKEDFQIADLCRMSHYFFVSVEAMAIRLESLGLVPKGVREYLNGSRFKVRAATSELGLTEQPVENRRFPDRYVSLAVQAYDRGLISESEFAGLLRCDRVEARRIAEAELQKLHSVSEDGEQQMLLFEAAGSQSLIQRKGN